MFEDGSPDTNAMNNAIVHEWNDTIKKGDAVWFLGDWAMSAKERAKYVPLLNGNIMAIKGNHDYKLNSVIGKNGETILTRFWFSMSQGNEKQYLLIHSPYDIGKVPKEIVDTIDCVICGHVHALWKYKKAGDILDAYNTEEHKEPSMIAPLPIINVGLDAWDFKIVTFEEIESLLEEITK